MNNRSIKLYFDKVSQKGRHGQTQVGEKILYNLNKIDPEKCVEFTDILMDIKMGDVSAFLPTGRFITIVTASMNVREKTMLTFDLMDNEMGAKEFFKEDPNYDTLMGVFYLIRKQYKKEYDKFILVEGDSPNMKAKD